MVLLWGEADTGRCADLQMKCYRTSENPEKKKRAGRKQESEPRARWWRAFRAQWGTWMFFYGRWKIYREGRQSIWQAESVKGTGPNPAPLPRLNDLRVGAWPKLGQIRIDPGSCVLLLENHVSLFPEVAKSIGCKSGTVGAALQPAWEGCPYKGNRHQQRINSDRGTKSWSSCVSPWKQMSHNPGWTRSVSRHISLFNST